MFSSRNIGRNHHYAINHVQFYHYCVEPRKKKRFLSGIYFNKKSGFL